MTAPIRVGLQLRSQALGGGLLRGDAVQTGVRGELKYVDPAVFGIGGGQGGGERGRVAGIGGVSGGADTFGCEFGLQGGELSGVAGDQGDVKTVAPEGTGERTAEAGACSDDGDAGHRGVSNR